MDGQTGAATRSLGPRVKANLVLGSESFAISPESGILSEQLATMKEKSMAILKEFITKHNAPNDVPDEPVEDESDGEGQALVSNPPKKSKKQKCKNFHQTMSLMSPSRLEGEALVNNPPKKSKKQK